MIFGNWEVGNEKLWWRGHGLHRFVISFDLLTRIQKTWKGETFYEWILLATNEDWLTQNDLYDLNYAFVYAVAKWGSDFDYDIFDATLEEQFDQLDSEEDDEENF